MNRRKSGYRTTDAFAYKDTGCGGRCVKSLDCPYPVCILDDPQVAVKERNQVNLQGIQDLLARGHTPLQAAKALNLSERSVYRLLEDS